MMLSQLVSMMRAKAPLIAHLAGACAASCERERVHASASPTIGAAEGGASAAHPPPAEKAGDGAYEAAEKMSEQDSAADGGGMEADTIPPVAAQQSASEATATAMLAAASRQIAPIVDRFGRAMADLSPLVTSLAHAPAGGERAARSGVDSIFGSNASWNQVLLGGVHSVPHARGTSGYTQMIQTAASRLGAGAVPPPAFAGSGSATNAMHASAARFEALVQNSWNRSAGGAAGAATDRTRASASGGGASASATLPNRTAMDILSPSRAGDGSERASVRADPQWREGNVEGGVVSPGHAAHVSAQIAMATRRAHTRRLQVR